MTADNPTVHVYDDLLMDHIKNARNYRVLHDVDRHATGTNPLCGDEVLVCLKMEGERIADVAFQCTCCGISMACASIMTEMVRGRLADDGRKLLREVVAMLKSGRPPAAHSIGAERLAMLETVRKFPARTRCAALPWVTLEGALDNNRDEPVIVR